MERRPNQQPEQEGKYTRAEQYLVNKLAYTDRTQGTLRDRSMATGTSQLVLLSRRLAIAEYSAPLPPISEPEDKFERELKTAVFGSRLALLNEALRREANYKPDGNYTTPGFAQDSPVGELHNLVDADQEGLAASVLTGSPEALGVLLSPREQAVVAELVSRAGVSSAQVPVFLPLDETELAQATILGRLRTHGRAIAEGRGRVADLPRFVGT